MPALSIGPQSLCFDLHNDLLPGVLVDSPSSLAAAQGITQLLAGPYAHESFVHTQGCRRLGQD